MSVWGGAWGDSWGNAWGALDAESLNVRVSWLQFDTTATPLAVSVSWLQFDTAASLVRAAISWIQFDTRAQPARVVGLGGKQRGKKKRAPDDDTWREERLEFLRQEDESLLFALVAIVASRRLH